MSKAEEMIEVYGIGEICLPSESGPTECTRTQRGEGHENGGLRKAWRCFNISVSYSVCPVWGMDRKPRLLARSEARIDERKMNYSR